MYAIILSTLVMYMRNKIYIEGFGKQKAIVTRIDGTWRFYMVEFTYKGKTYYSVVTNEGRTLMPFTTDPIIEVFKTKNNKEWCFTKKKEDIGYQSYHYSVCNNNYILKANIYGTNYSSCRIVNTVKNDYWFIETVTDKEKEWCLYDPYKAEILTPTFTNISFEEAESRILAYVERDLITTIDNNKYYLGSICSYIDKNGKFVTPIYVPELDLMYDARAYNTDPNFKAFNTFSNAIKSKLEKINNEKDEHIIDILTNLFQSPYAEDDMIISNKPAKIIKFPGGKNET